MPLVSICIPTYNSGAMLRDALRSASTQTLGDIEILVLDNASSDGTEQLVRECAAKDPRIRYIRHAENVGMARNFTACIENAQGRYVKILCSDDVLLPRCTEVQAAMLDAHKEVALVGCAREAVDEALRPVGLARFRAAECVFDGKRVSRECFFWGNRIGEPSAVLFRRADAMRGFCDRYSQLIDLEMWFALLQRGSFAFLPEVLCRVRTHGAQTTQENLRSGRVLEDKRQLFREFAASLGREASLFEWALWDGRMALSLWRSRRAGLNASPTELRELFFAWAFPGLTYPAVTLLCALGLAGRT